MKKWAQSFIVAFGMYSKIPMPKVEWNKKNMEYAICFFPCIGAVIAGLVYLWYVLAAHLDLHETLRVSVALFIPVAVTGGIHLDGFLDTADALSSYQSREKKLEILKDPHMGAFAVIWAICYFILGLGIWSALSFRGIQLTALGFIVSRSLSGISVVCFKKARDNGMLSSFSKAAQGSRRLVMAVLLLWLAGAAAAMVLVDWKGGSIVLAVSLLVFAWYRRMSYREFGGITGDLAGFFLQVCELAAAGAVLLGELLF